MSMLNTEVVRSEIRHRYARESGLEGDWARVEGWRGSRVRRARRRGARRTGRR